jgi:hypothetical protein
VYISLALAIDLTTDDVSTPVFTFSVLDACGVRLAGREIHR